LIYAKSEVVFLCNFWLHTVVEAASFICISMLGGVIMDERHQKIDTSCWFHVAIEADILFLVLDIMCIISHYIGAPNQHI
jgi:hypothetical protein